METNNKQIVKNLYAALAAGKAEEALGILSTDFIDHDINSIHDNVTRMGLKEIYTNIRSAFTEFSSVLSDLIEENDWVSVRIEAAGKHSRDLFMGMPSTGKFIKWQEIHFFRCMDNKIVEHKGIIDMMGIMQQLYSPDQV